MIDCDKGVKNVSKFEKEKVERSSVNLYMDARIVTAMDKIAERHKLSRSRVAEIILAQDLELQSFMEESKEDEECDTENE